MNEDLVAYLDAIDARLCDYLDEDHDLSLRAVEHLYRYALALRQGLIEPACVAEDWEDFFSLADAFVFAYGAQHLEVLRGRSALLEGGGGDEPAPLTDTDRMFLVALVAKLDDFISARQSTAEGSWS